MAESELTKEIKLALRDYAPQMKSKMRTIRWAEEVDVGTGYVDAIRFEDYVERDDSFCARPTCKIDGREYPCKDCTGCVFIRRRYELGILTTCFEIKISKSDFKSHNGHNFVGNRNYYVIPKELYKQIVDLVPEDVGIILYHGHRCLIKKKDSAHKDIDQSDLSRFLYNALKKWADGYYRGDIVDHNPNPTLPAHGPI